MTGETPKRVLLIGWDAADWQMIEPLMAAGEMPNMKRFVEEGVSGNVATLQPALSPMLWTSIVTGKHADKHGVLGFAEVDPKSGKARPVTSTGRGCKAIWNILSDAGRPSGAINWYASHPAEKIDGFVVTDRFAHPTGILKEGEPLLGWETVARSVHPAEDLEDIAKVRVHPQMISHEQVQAFVPGATDPASANWEKIRELRVLLAHCATVHNAATAFMDARDWDFLGIYYDAIDRFAHAFMEFHPPKLGHVSDQDFELYQGIMNECYRFHDLMLGRLMNMIDDETAVVILSDHGFHSGVTRPEGTSGIADGQPAAWHRPYGVIAFWGPGMKRGAKLYGATLLDVTPTILTMLGMDPARDMDGLPLTQIWEEPRLQSERVETYETGGDAIEEEEVEQTDVDEQIMHQLQQLGYVGNDEADDIVIDRARNLGTVYMSTGRPRQALEQFELVQRMRPGTAGIGLSIGACMLSLGKLDEAERMVGESAPSSTARGRVLLAMICARRGDRDGSLEHLIAARAMEEGLPGIDAKIGEMLVKLGRWDEAEGAFERALERDPDDADALDGIGVVYHNTGRDAEAVLSHTKSIALVRNRAATHLHLGEALVSVERTGWAIEAFVEAARIAPWDAAPHARLGDVYERIIGNKAKAAFHRDRAEKIRALRKAKIAEMQTGAEPSAKVEKPMTSRGADSVSGGKRTGNITIVSGLPRSGTSLMMQMLAAGGMSVLSDGERIADENNPRGYLEFEAVKHTATDASWVALAPGHAVKVIHALLRSLPAEYDYSVIFMKRRLEEVVASQDSMLERLGREGTTLGSEALRAAYAREYERTGAWLSEQENFRVLEVSYNSLLAEPQSVAELVRGFIEIDLDVTRMQGVIDPELYRARAGEGNEKQEDKPTGASSQLGINGG